MFYFIKYTHIRIEKSQTKPVKQVFTITHFHIVFYHAQILFSIQSSAKFSETLDWNDCLSLNKKSIFYWVLITVHRTDLQPATHTFLPQVYKKLSKIFLVSCEETFLNLIRLLCISTSKQVLCTPFTGWNRLFDSNTTISITNGKK